MILAQGLIRPFCYQNKVHKVAKIFKHANMYWRLNTMLTSQEKIKVIEKVKIHDKDTGSAEAQIALFTEEIEQLAKHLKKHGKDNSSRLGLLKMVSKRKRLLDYLKREAPKRHASVIKKLGLDK